MRTAVIALQLLFALPILADQRLGTIVFPNSGKPAAQAAFLRGVALLHNFAYPQAAAAFQEAEKSDPQFALAYWGEAMTHNHPLWYQYDKDGGRAALAKLKTRPADARERGYLDAVEALYGDAADHNAAYESAMERLARANPDDVEAQAFWALSILGTRARDEVNPRKQIRAAAILEPLFAAHPEHPGVLHYLIHAYDDPIHAPLGLRAARRYSKVASDAPHALHMPSHIFLQLGMWDDAARSNEAAYALSKQWSEPDYHSLEWLQYIYLQQGRFADAKKLVDEAASGSHGERQHHALSHMRARYAIESGQWNAFDFAGEHDAPSIFARGLQAVAQHDLDAARRAATELKSIDDKAARVMEDELGASILEAAGNGADALARDQDAIAAEEVLGTPSGPPDDIKPAHEALGEALLRAGKKKEAAAAFEASLLRTPNRRLSLQGAAQSEIKP
jgi:hypothetical protein